MKKDYEKLESVTVKSQEELDDIPDNYAGRIYVEFGNRLIKAVVAKRYAQHVVARENASVVARGNASVEAWENASVVARGNASVEAWGNASVEARENASVEARENASVVARGNASVEAWENASVVARGNASVVAWGNASVEAWGNASVEARGNASVEAWENASVEAWGNASVEAWENASVVAWGNASVVADGNCQVVDRLRGGRIEISGNARIVYMPKTIEEYCAFYGIKHDKKKGRFFKAVHKHDGIYFSNFNLEFMYKIGEKVKAGRFNTDLDEECGEGIHMSYLQYAMDFGRFWSDLAILEVEADMDGIILPNDCPGKVRCAEVKVIREVPLEECGIMGKILLKRMRHGYEEGEEN